MYNATLCFPKAVDRCSGVIGPLPLLISPLKKIAPDCFGVSKCCGHGSQRPFKLLVISPYFEVKSAKFVYLCPQAPCSKLPQPANYDPLLSENFFDRLFCHPFTTLMWDISLKIIFSLNPLE